MQHLRKSFSKSCEQSLPIEYELLNAKGHEGLGLSCMHR
jgi:hypothetical protein